MKLAMSKQRSWLFYSKNVQNVIFTTVECMHQCIILNVVEMTVVKTHAFS